MEKIIRKYGKNLLCVEVECSFCRNLFFKEKGKTGIYKTQYCSKKCQTESRKFDLKDSDTKKCIICKIEKPRTLEYYYARNVSPDGLTPRCKECLKPIKADIAVKYREASPEKVKATNKNGHLKRKYGITLEEYKKILENQKHLCLICNQPETRKHKGNKVDLVVDHCHKTGKFRGLICDSCNVGLARFKDNPEILQGAINYLNEYGS